MTNSFGLYFIPESLKENALEINKEKKWKKIKKRFRINKLF